MLSCMCKFAFVRDNSNSVLLLTLKFFQRCFISASPRCICIVYVGVIARLFYLNKVLFYIIYLCVFDNFIFSKLYVFFPCVLSLQTLKCLSNKTPRSLVDFSLCIS